MVERLKHIISAWDSPLLKIGLDKLANFCLFNNHLSMRYLLKYTEFSQWAMPYCENFLLCDLTKAYMTLSFHFP